MDTVATWSVPLQDRVHRIEFQHGTTTGKRIITIDGQVILRREWMFKLVGKETFHVGNIPCTITIDALGTFAYEYSLEVNGKAFEKFREEQNRKLQSWHTNIGGSECRICLDKNTMDMWVNGVKIETAGEFSDSGTETHFVVNSVSCAIQSINSGKKSTGVTHKLLVDGRVVPADMEKPEK